MIFGLSYFFPEIGILLHGKEISFGDLGLFVILAYVAGHLAQGVGDFIERKGRSYNCDIIGF